MPQMDNLIALVANRCWPRGHSCDVAIGNTENGFASLGPAKSKRCRGT
jgi:hypothetical protein